MPERADNTGFILNNLTNTHSGLNWLLDYFHYTRMKIVDGEWDKAAARQQFKDAVMKPRPRTLLGSEISEDTIDWERLYNECWETTKPKDDWGKQEFRKRLERRGIDPDLFGWDLILTGEQYEYAWEKTRSTTRPNEENATSEQEPEKRMPWEEDDFELAVAGIEAGMRSIEATMQAMKLSLGQLQQMVEDRNGDVQSE